MKKILSIVALVAMLSVPFSLVSCGDDDPLEPIHKPDSEMATYILQYVYAQDINENVISQVNKFFREKMGSDVTMEKGADVNKYIISISNKAKGDAIIKGLSKYEDELGKLLKDNSASSYLELVISNGSDVLFQYVYNSGADVSFAGTYTYTDENGAVWTLILTDESSSEAGYKVGSLNVPNDANGAKSGLYTGKYLNRGEIVSFRSDQMQEGGSDFLLRLTAGFNQTTEAGIPMSLLINGKTAFSKVLFQKK